MGGDLQELPVALQEWGLRDGSVAPGFLTAIGERAWGFFGPDWAADQVFLALKIQRCEITGQNAYGSSQEGPARRAMQSYPSAQR